METLPLGTRIGPYRIISPLGDGGVGVVYRAQDETLERAVALKILHPEYASSESFRETFLEEARAMAEFDHPRLVRVFAYGEVEGRAYLVMELVRGRDLKTHLAERGGKLPPAAVLRIVDDVAAGLRVLHDAKRIHGDVKPGNVLLDERGRARLTDLGLSHRLGAVGADVVRGTPQYMAPERARGLSVPPKMQAQQDVYSLACVAFEMLTGRPPFVSQSTAELLSKHACTPPPAPSSFEPALGPRVDEVILRALDKTPSERWPGARSFARALRRALSPLRSVWIVDDDPDHAATLAAIVQRHVDGVAVRSWDDAEEALDAAVRTPPELLLIDLHMPRMDGLELLAHVRHAVSTELPVVVVTGQGSSREWRRLHAAGADACLLKPVVPRQLAMHVDNLLRAPRRVA